MADVRWTLIVCLVWLLAAWLGTGITHRRAVLERRLDGHRGSPRTIDSSKLESEISLQARLPFFGFHYKYIKVHLNGYLHFSGAPATFRFPVRFPMRPEDTIREKDPALIAPWLSYQSMVQHIPESGVYFRLFRIGEHNDRDPEQWLERRAIEDFREGMIGAADFRPTFVVIATWRNVTLTGMQSKSNVKTNTYQVVLASDERRTYVMFNYEKIDWIAVNDVNNGENGENPFVGFNAGNTTRYYEFIPYSQEPRVKNLPQHGEGNGIKGRYIFEIEEEIWHGSCIKWELVPHLITSRPRLTFFPKYASMLGGALINVTGPCFDPNEKIECQFQDMSGHRLPAIYRDTNHATCLMPPVFFHGYVDLTVSQGSRDAMFYGRFYVQPPELAAEDIEILDDNDKAERPERMRIKWNPNKLVNNNNTNVQLHLWGYNDDLEYPQLTYIDTLASGMRNGEMRYTLNMEMYRERYNWDKLHFKFGFLSINLTDGSAIAKDYKNSPTIWSRPMPLAWYFAHQWDRAYGSNWKDRFCNEWFERESNADRGAQHCVRTGRPSVGGSGQTCCYDMEGELMLTADTMYGGRPSRIFSYGILPFNSRMKVPTLSNWNIDSMPFFYCCHWQHTKDDSTSCQQYKYWRTSQDCTAYQPPGYAAVFGDPHFLTFDRANYTFTARGEFVLVRVNDPKGKLEIQGRFESVRRALLTDRMVNGTFLSAVAVRDNVSSTVEIHLRPLAARFIYQLYLVVDNEFIYFWDDTMRIQHFKGVTIYQPTGYYNMSKIVCMFDSGAGVEVLVKDEQLSMNVFLPVEFVNITKGLLGFWDKKKENDFMPPHGNAFVPITASLEQIYHQFGNLWRLNESNSLFNHDLMGYKFGHYDDQSFLPYLEDPPTNTTEFHIPATGCSRYMFGVKGLYIRLHTQEVREQVIRCPAIDKPANGRKSEIRNFVGRTVRFTCNEGYRLVGHEVRQCKEYGLWSWGVDVTCISNASYARKIAGVTLGILLPIALIFCIVFFCFFKRNRHKNSHYTGSNGDFSKFPERRTKTYHGPAPEKVSETTT
ncbi:hypothetical protein MRX96_038092 [Rhipicephalus microplus]